MKSKLIDVPPLLVKIRSQWLGVQVTSAIDPRHGIGCRNHRRSFLIHPMCGRFDLHVPTPHLSEYFGWAAVMEKGKTGKQPYYIRPADDAERRHRTHHNRMPVIRPRQAWAVWLDPENRQMETLGALLVRCPAEALRAYPVSTAVNRAGADGEGVIAALRE